MTINLECIAWVYYWLLRNLFGFPMGTLACLLMLVIIIILLKVKWVYWRSVYVKVLTVKFTCVPFKVWWHYLSGISHSLSLPLPLSYLSLSHCSIPLTLSTMPPSHAILVEHMTQMLQQSQSTSILRSVQKLISVAVERSTTSSLIRPTYIKGESTCTL